MERYVVLYDADCGFCRWSLDKILRWGRGRELRAVAIQSEEGDRLLADMSEDERLASWHIVTPDGRRFSGGSAAGPLARLLPLAPHRCSGRDLPSHDRPCLRVGGAEPRLARSTGRLASLRARLWSTPTTQLTNLTPAPLPPNPSTRRIRLMLWPRRRKAR
jgi:hypothetical protein